MKSIYKVIILAAIAVALLLATLQSNGQERVYTYGPQSSTQSAIIKGSSDTLEILRPDKIHFIKIGDRIYKIESPMLIEVPNNKWAIIPPYGSIKLTSDSLTRYPINFYNMKATQPKGTIFAY